MKNIATDYKDEAPSDQEIRNAIYARDTALARFKRASDEVKGMAYPPESLRKEMTAADSELRAAAGTLYFFLMVRRVRNKPFTYGDKLDEQTGMRYSDLTAPSYTTATSFSRDGGMAGDGLATIMLALARNQQLPTCEESTILRLSRMASHW